MAYVIVLVTSLVVAVTHAQFNPGCSFNDGHCMYNVELGHYGSCDKRAVTSDTGCCDALTNQVTGLTNDVNTLKSQVSTLMSELTTSKDNLTSTQTLLTEEQLRTQQLLETLREKEAALNRTESQLAHVLNQAGDEIRTLRATVGRLTSELNTCRGTLGLATNTSRLPDSSFLATEALVTFCDFESHGGAVNETCGYGNSSTGFHRGSGKQDDRTGPLEDHTYGSPQGHYMFMDAVKTAHTSSSSYEKSYSMTSQEYPAGPGYCIRFWYNMYGRDVKDLQVYAKISHAGSGYPVFSRTGDQQRTWHLAERDLDSEYTSHPFHLVFTATTTAYHHSSYSMMDPYGDVAIDDIYVYNTSCKNIPLCPTGGVTRQSSTTTTCYTFHVEPTTWYDAAATCRREGATSSLVTIQSKDEQDFIVQTIKNDTALTAAGQYGFYTAGNDEREEHTFDWTDTGYPYRGTYTNWKEGQPNNVAGDQDCLLLQYPDLDYQWGDVDCDERHPFICKTQYPTPNRAASGSPLIG